MHCNFTINISDYNSLRYYSKPAEAPPDAAKIVFTDEAPKAGTSETGSNFLQRLRRRPIIASHRVRTGEFYGYR
jgi:hypothetical protein